MPTDRVPARGRRRRASPWSRRRGNTATVSGGIQRTASRNSGGSARGPTLLPPPAPDADAALSCAGPTNPASCCTPRLTFSSSTCARPAGTERARAQVNTLRLRLLKVGARVREGVRRVRVQLSQAYAGLPSADGSSASRARLPLGPPRRVTAARPRASSLALRPPSSGHLPQAPGEPEVFMNGAG